MDDMKDLCREVDLLKEQVINMKQSVQVLDVRMIQNFVDLRKAFKEIIVVLNQIAENTRKEEKDDSQT